MNVVCRTISYFLAGTAAHAAPVIRAEFDTNTGFPGGVVTVSIVIDGDNSIPGLQPVANGIFNAGVRAIVPEGSPVAVRPVGALNSSGFGSGAEIIITETSIAFEGNVDLSNGTGVPYTGNLLAEFDFKIPVGNPIFPVVLELPKERVTETVLVDGNGNDLDSEITFVNPVISVLTPLEIERNDGGVRLRYGTAANFTFEVQGRNDLNVGSPWVTLPGAPHNGGSLVVPVDRATRFFRVLMNR